MSARRAAFAATAGLVLTLLVAASVRHDEAHAAETDGRYGSPAAGMPVDREIRLRASAESIGVWRLETINFVAANGRAFRWRFDTMKYLDAFPLARIAPPDAAVPAATMVYVNGEIPIAP